MTELFIQRDRLAVRRATGDLHVDVYRPKSMSEPLPVVLYLHGGAWLRGRRDDHAAARLQPLSRRGVVVVSGSYRFSDIAPWPAQLLDVADLTRWIFDNADELGADPTRLSVWGASAGGHLAMMVSLLSGSAELQSTTASAAPIRSTIAWFAPADLRYLGLDPRDPDARRPASIPTPTDSTPPHHRLLAGVARDLDQAMREASPVSHVTAGTPPLLLVYGSQDALMPLAQAKRMAVALSAAGVEHQLLIVDGASHEDDRFHSPAILGAVHGWVTR